MNKCNPRRVKISFDLFIVLTGLDWERAQKFSFSGQRGVRFLDEGCWSAR